MTITFTEGKILFCLGKFIHENEICNYILELKKEKEFEENQLFHFNLWENIVGNFYNDMEIHNKYESRILRNTEFLIKCDINLNYPIQSYYLITNYSYECRNYLLFMIN